MAEKRETEINEKYEELFGGAGRMRDEKKILKVK